MREGGAAEVGKMKSKGKRGKCIICNTHFHN